MTNKPRCWWCGEDPPYCEYHDKEWGVPVHDDRKMFEMLTLEGFQAGLSWITILRKRDNFRKAFKNFNARKEERICRQRAWWTITWLIVLNTGRNRVGVLSPHYPDVLRPFRRCGHADSPVGPSAPPGAHAAPPR